MPTHLQIRNCKGQALNAACLWACLKHLHTRILSESYKKLWRIRLESYKNPNWNSIRNLALEDSTSRNYVTLRIRNCKGQDLNGACLWTCLGYLDTRILSESYQKRIIIKFESYRNPNWKPIRNLVLEDSISWNSVTLPIRNCNGQALNGACLWACLGYLDTRILSESCKKLRRIKL